jgi:hypothetical protein
MMSDPTQKFTPLDAMRSALHSRRVCIRNGWPTGDDIKIDSGPDDYRREWPADFEKAWQQLSTEERAELAGWRRFLFRD